LLHSGVLGGVGAGESGPGLLTEGPIAAAEAKEGLVMNRQSKVSIILVFMVFSWVS